MARLLTRHTLRTYTEDLARVAQAESGVPSQIAEHARDVTLRNLSQLGDRALDAAARRRVRAYFRAVVRRSAVRSRVPGAREYRIRAMVASVVADLQASGADHDRISREVAAWLAAHEGAA
jgi:type IV pilus biogenesis protein CpaD/CtpE